MTTPVVYGLTPAGFLRKPLEVIINEAESGLEAEFGNINTEPESVFGQLIGTTSKPIEDLWETIEAVYFSQYPNSAEGTALDNVALLLGITRLPATSTRVVAVVGGTEGTLIPAGSLAAQPSTGFTFQAAQNAIITRASANYARVNLFFYNVGLTYTVVINGQVYSVVAVTPNQVVTTLVALIGTISTSTRTYYATYIDDYNFSVQAFDSEIPFNISPGENVAVFDVTTPMIFVATQTGPIVVPTGTLTQTVTSISGWTSINNLKPGTTGTNIETDAELRLRRSRSFLIGGYATVESIRAHLLQEVPGVVHVDIIENRTMLQSPQTFSTNADFQVNDIIDVIFDGLGIGQINYNAYGTQLGAMNAIRNLLLAQAGVATVTIGPAPYRTLTMTFVQGYQLTFNDLIIERGLPVQFIPFSKTGGRPPKSFETIVQGGTDSDVANKIWFTKPAGIETFGNTRFIITDSMGNEQAIFFTRAQALNIWVIVDAGINPEEPLAGGSIEAATAIIKQNIMQYAATLQIGNDVINQRILCRVIDVSGIGSAVVRIAARTDGGTPAPGEYTTGNIIVGGDQIATFNLDHITVNIT